MDAIDLLVRQHRELEALMKQVKDAPDDEATMRGFKQAADLLTMHIMAEELVFYPAVKARRTEDILLESLEEHLSLKRLLADLLDMKPGEQMFTPKFKVLKEQAEHHHEEEEEHLFPKVKQLLDDQQRESLGQEMLELENRLDREGKPRRLVLDQTNEAAPL